MNTHHVSSVVHSDRPKYTYLKPTLCIWKRDIGEVLANVLPMGLPGRKKILFFFRNQPIYFTLYKLARLKIYTVLGDENTFSSDVFPFELESIFTDKKGYKKNPLRVSERRDQYCFPKTPCRGFTSLFVVPLVCAGVRPSPKRFPPCWWDTVLP
jgi:hypothetical protein